jgi:hypothetical protein
MRANMNGRFKAMLVGIGIPACALTLVYFKILPEMFIGISFGFLAGIPVLFLTAHFIGYEKMRSLPFSLLSLATFMWIFVFVSSYISLKPGSFIFSLGNATSMAIGVTIADVLFKALEMRRLRLAIFITILFVIYCFLIYPTILFYLYAL